MVNYDGIYELRMFYTTVPTGMTPMEHRLTFDVLIEADLAPGTAWAAIVVQTHDGSDAAITDFLDNIQDVIEPLYPATTDFSRWELWKIPEGTTDALFINALEIGHVGSALTPSIPAKQTTFTFRSVGGGVARLQFMESIDGNEGFESVPYSVAAFANLAAFAIGDSSAIMARDNTKIFSNIHWNSGQNEKLWRKRFRA